MRKTASSGWPRASAVRPAGQRLGDLIQVGDAAFGVGRDHRVADAAQRDLQQLAPLAGAQPARTRIASPKRDDERAREEVGDQADHVAGVWPAESWPRGSMNR